MLASDIITFMLWKEGLFPSLGVAVMSAQVCVAIWLVSNLVRGLDDGTIRYVSGYHYK